MTAWRGIVIGVAIVAVAAIVKGGPATTQAVTGPGEWVEVGRGVRARAVLGFWRDGHGERPGRAARVVRLIPQGERAEHFGITVELDLPAKFSGKLHYREQLK